MGRYAVLGLGDNVSVAHRGIYPVRAGDLAIGDVKTFVSPDGLMIINKTRPGHLF